MKYLYMVLAAILAVGVILGIKALNLPGWITALLVIAILAGLMIVLGKYGMSSETEEEDTKTSNSSLDKP